MAKIKTLKDKGEVFYPQTHIEAVVDDNGNTVTGLIDKISREIAPLETEIGELGNKIAELEKLSGGSADIPLATIENDGLMSAEDKDKLNKASENIDYIFDINETEYFTDTEDYVLQNPQGDTIDKDGNTLTITSSDTGSGKNRKIILKLGTPNEGEQVTVVLKIKKVKNQSGILNMSIRKGADATYDGTAVSTFTITDDGDYQIYATTFTGVGTPLALYVFVSGVVTTNSGPLEIEVQKASGKPVDQNPTTLPVAHIKEALTPDIRAIVNESSLVVNKMVGQFYDTAGNLVTANNYSGTAMMEVSPGLTFKVAEATLGYNSYAVFFDSNKVYKSASRFDVVSPALLNSSGYCKIQYGIKYVAITIFSNAIESFNIQVIDKNNLGPFVVTWDNLDSFGIRNMLPQALRKDSVMITYADQDTGKWVIEQFNNADNINILTNSFATAKYWKRIATLDDIDFAPHPMKDKKFWSIGDSHRWKWNQKLVELTGAKSGSDLLAYITNKNNTVKAIDGDESSADISWEDKYVSRCVSMAKRLVDLYKDGEQVDYIFLEYVHKYFTNDLAPSDTYYYSGDITQAEPFLAQAYYIYNDMSFNTDVEAKNYWDSNYQNIISKFTPVPNAIIALKSVTKKQSPKFKLASGSVTKDGNFIISFTGANGKTYSANVYITAGKTLNDALTEINAMSFRSQTNCLWTNVNSHSTVTDATLVFSYLGDRNDADASIKMSFDGTTTGIVLDGDFNIADSVYHVTRGFRSHDVIKWDAKDKWAGLNANMDAYIWIKAAVELLQREIPTAKIFVWTLCTESWDYANNTIEGKSVLYPDGTLNVQAIYDSDSHKRMIQNAEGWEKVAKYYHLGFIPISEMNSISPANHKYYYASNDVHPTQEGYDRVAEILAQNVY